MSVSASEYSTSRFDGSAPPPPGVDEVMLKEAMVWVEAIVGPVAGGFPEGLKDGIALCELVNKFKAGTIAKINNPAKMPFKKMENVTNAIKAMRGLGQKEFELMTTVDLTEDKNLQQCVEGHCVHVCRSPVV